MTDKNIEFRNECQERIDSYASNNELRLAAKNFNVASNGAQYSYNFSWMGRPIIQYPQDMIAMQMLIWDLKPDLIIETGIAHGGSLIFYASLLEMIGKGEVLGIDIDIRSHNKAAIENHKMYKRIEMIEGSSIDPAVISKVASKAKDCETVLVLLDSNHTHDHVINELRLYSPFVTLNSYLVCFDTIVEEMPEGYLPDRAWSVGDNPKTALYEFIKENDSFEIDRSIDNMIQISVAPEGYLKRIK